MHMHALHRAGAATTTVSSDGDAGTIDIVKTGEGSLTNCVDQRRGFCRWGDYSAVSVVEGRAWFTNVVAATFPSPPVNLVLPTSWISTASLE